MSFYAAIKKSAKTALAGRRGAGAVATLLVLGALATLGAMDFFALRMFAPPPSDYWRSGAVEPTYFLRVFFGQSPQELIIAGLALATYLMLLAPLFLGMARWHYVLIQGDRPNTGELLHFFRGGRRYGRAVWHNVQLTLRCLGWGIVFLALPSGLLSICVRFLLIDGLTRTTRMIASVGIVVAFALLVMAAVLYAIYLGKYALSGYLLCESDRISVRQALRTSIRYTKGYRGVKFLFTLSFAGWYLLVPATLLVALVFVLTYHMAGETVFARYLVEKNRAELSPVTREFGGAA
ncbi:MAG: DUF975 family protein [Oscillospiraceae bacterium]|nr:DUF975 family protein [Oscillospiraceae bacterium]